MQQTTMGKIAAAAVLPTLLLLLAPSTKGLDLCSTTLTRRRLLIQVLGTTVGGATSHAVSALAVSPDAPFVYTEEWAGTLLPRRGLAESVASVRGIDGLWPMARWPDPVLRIPAEPVASKWMGSKTLAQACDTLARTARHHGAVGLAAQQCGLNARIVYLEVDHPVSRGRQIRRNVSTSSITLVNPRIVGRSPEVHARVWNEGCLVLPPALVATVLRDSWVDVDYQTVEGDWRRIRLADEAARAVQHELDHDRGILITDHVSLDELLDPVMRDLEREGHEERMVVAFDREIYEPALTAQAV